MFCLLRLFIKVVKRLGLSLGLLGRYFNRRYLMFFRRV